MLAVPPNEVNQRLNDGHRKLTGYIFCDTVNSKETEFIEMLIYLASRGWYYTYFTFPGRTRCAWEALV